jgi:hypothetical protein
LESKSATRVCLYVSLCTGTEWQPCVGRDPGEQCAPLALDTGAMSHCSCPPLWLTRACSQVLRDRRIIRLVGAAAIPLLNGVFFIQTCSPSIQSISTTNAFSGLVTSNVAKLKPGDTQATVFLSAQGRVAADALLVMVTCWPPITESLF